MYAYSDYNFSFIHVSGMGVSQHHLHSNPNLTMPLHVKWHSGYPATTAYTEASNTRSETIDHGRLICLEANGRSRIRRVSRIHALSNPQT